MWECSLGHRAQGLCPPLQPQVPSSSGQLCSAHPLEGTSPGDLSLGLGQIPLALTPFSQLWFQAVVSCKMEAFQVSLVSLDKSLILCDPISAFEKQWMKGWEE